MLCRPSQYVKIRNFEVFQHYKDRNPPWIKLYARLWRDRNFQKLSDEHKAHLIGLFSLASNHENKLLWDEEWIARELVTTRPLDLKALLDSGFVLLCRGKSSASKTLADSEQASIAETETYKAPEAETETDSRARVREGFDRFYAAYPRKENPKYALRCWEKLQPNAAEQGKMLAWLERAKLSRQWQDPDKIPHPSTWLNQRRWEGDPPPTAVGNRASQVGLNVVPSTNSPEREAESERLRAKIRAKDEARDQAKEDRILALTNPSRRDLQWLEARERSKQNA